MDETILDKYARSLRPGPSNVTSGREKAAAGEGGIRGKCSRGILQQHFPGPRSHFEELSGL
jgi:hypothetical protein